MYTATANRRVTGSVRVCSNRSHTNKQLPQPLGSSRCCNARKGDPQTFSRHPTSPNYISFAGSFSQLLLFLYRTLAILPLTYFILHEHLHPRCSPQALLTKGVSESVLGRFFGKRPECTFFRNLQCPSLQNQDGHLQRISPQLQRGGPRWHQHCLLRSQSL